MPPLPSTYLSRIYWFLMSSIFCPYWIPWVNVDIVRWCCNWILLNIFRAQTIDQIQSAIYAINQNISSNNRQCIKSYSSHKWKQTNFSKTKYLEIFLQLRRRNRQYIPKRNLLWRLVNIFPVQYPIQEVSYFGCSSCSKVPFVL